MKPTLKQLFDFITERREGKWDHILGKKKCSTLGAAYYACHRDSY